MADHRPDRMVGDERTTLLALLQFQRESIVRKVSGITDEQARTSPVPSGTTLQWLIRHVKFAEEVWVVRNYGDRAIIHIDDTETQTVEQAIASYRLTWEIVDELVWDAASLDVPCRDGLGGPDTTLRWAVMHLLEEVARHAGHADILRELIDGQTGR